MSEVKQFRLPDVGEGLTEADIVSWHVKPGDAVKVNQVIVEIETAKAVVELPCPFEGIVTGLLVDEGANVAVGTPIIAVDVAPDADSAGDRTATAGVPAGASGDLVPSPPPDTAVEPGIHGSPAPKVERQAVLVGYGVRLGATKRRQRKNAAPPAASASGSAASEGRVLSPSIRPSAGEAPGADSAAVAIPAVSGNGRVLAKPPVRKLAKELGVDLAGVAGSGPGGSITREDVQGAVPGAGQPAWPAGGAVLREERIAVRGVRKHTAAAVSASAFTAPHVTEFLQVDVTASMAAVKRLRELAEFAELRVSPLLLVAKAVLVAVARHPMINSSWDEQAREIVVKHYVNLGIAAATERGLIVPNIKDAHLQSLPGLARALAELTATARAGKAQPADLAGGTITITNVGVFGVDAGTPILTPGEAAILAFGQVREMPWVHQGQIAVRQVTTLSLSFDHRIVDGGLGSAFLRDIGAMLADPVAMLAWS
jgi:2-oxoisovalerate dehydrogenase E2 component (dihydrolipoyl transacylase)